MLQACLTWLNKPEYIFRPRQIPARLRAMRSRSQASFDSISLPWGLAIRFRRADVLGDALHRSGVYDLAVSETIWRLLDMGEVAVDIGANIGYMTSIMAARGGPDGTVWAFEPHPETFLELSRNVAAWESAPTNARINPIRAALADHTGRACLRCPSDPVTSRVMASLASADDASEPDDSCHGVDLLTLDETLANVPQIGLMKIDVEGHEIEVLRGGERLFSQQRVRDVIFEAHDGYPSEASTFLERCGYGVLRLTKAYWRLLAIPPEEPVSPELSRYEPPSFLATASPRRAAERLSRPGWRVLHPRRR